MARTKKEGVMAKGSMSVQTPTSRTKGSMPMITSKDSAYGLKRILELTRANSKRDAITERESSYSRMGRSTRENSSTASIMDTVNLCVQEWMCMRAILRTVTI